MMTNDCEARETIHNGENLQKGFCNSNCIIAQLVAERLLLHNHC